MSTEILLDAEIDRIHEDLVRVIDGMESHLSLDVKAALRSHKALHAEVARLTAALAAAEREAEYAQMWRDLDVTPAEVHKAYTERMSLRAEVARLKAAMVCARHLEIGDSPCPVHGEHEEPECDRLRAERDQLRALVQAVAETNEERDAASMALNALAEDEDPSPEMEDRIKLSFEAHDIAIRACVEEAKKWEK